MRVIVDVDGTLVDFHRPLHKLLQTFFPDMPGELATEWDWYDDYMTDKQFYAACDIVHSIQMTSHDPLPGAVELFQMLNEHNAEIFVASHRKAWMAPQMAAWLARNGLGPYSLVYTGSDKHFMIEPNTIVIDDAPHTITYALDQGAYPVYLDWPWNNGGHESLYEVSNAVSEMLK